MPGHQPAQVGQVSSPEVLVVRHGRLPLPPAPALEAAVGLAGLGLLAEEREHTGRRRRSYRITEQGQAALADWLAQATDEPPQFRSLGLLKLFFSRYGEPRDVAELARSQLELHRRNTAIAEGIIQRLRARGDRPGQLAVAELMADAYRVMTAHWERIERSAGELDGRVAP